MTQRRAVSGPTGNVRRPGEDERTEWREGLRPGVPPVSSPAIFVTSTKLGCEAGRQMEYLAAIRVPAMRRLIQVSDGVSVHLKKDLIDKLLYRTTMGLRVGGVVYCLVALYVAAQPSNK
uniref:Cytochrome c oxidase subunit 7A2 like n=1 Tax=Amphiprion percula TaxID=161767 RepID=A0A3P8TFM2_AMPPE